MSHTAARWALGGKPPLNKIPFTRWFASWNILYLFRVRLRTFLRAIGLKIFTFLSYKHEEPSKVLINKSRSLASARSTIHLLPASVSLGLIILNFQAYFIGAELQGARDQDNLKLGLLQVAAKIQELLVVSSLGVVIFHALRHELIFGQGLPLGLIVSGWSFTQLSYFWSPEFWAGVIIREKTSARYYRRYAFLLLVFMAGMIAVLAGPAAAILMIPRELETPVGGGVFWLNGSDEQLWPTYLDSQYYDQWNCTTQEKYLVSPKCPSAGFLPLYMYYSTWWNYPMANFQFELQDTNVRKLMTAWPSSQPAMDTWAFTGHTASATLQDAFVTMHSRALNWLVGNKPREYPYPQNINFAQSRRYEVKTKLPAVRTACVHHNMTDLRTKNLTVRFPILPEFIKVGQTPQCGDEIEVSQLIEKSMAKRGLLYNNDIPLDEMLLNGSRRIVSIPVPIPNHTVSSLGLILFVNRTVEDLDQDAENFNLATCSIDARWVPGETIISTVVEPLAHEFFNNKVRNLIGAEFYIKNPTVLYPSPIDGTEDGLPIGIHLTPDWYDIFSPVITQNVFQIPGLLGAMENQTTLERILEVSMSNKREYLLDVQCTISTAVADGLSRSGLIPNDRATRFLGAEDPGQSLAILNESIARKILHLGNPKEVFPAPPILAGGNMTRMEMTAKFTGYAIYARGRFDYFSIILLLGHAIVALAHTIWVVFWGQTGESWDNIAEMIALAHKSPPPKEETLNNTCAGIITLKTLSSVAWVETSESKDNLRLRFKEDGGPRAESLKPQVDQAYNI